MNIDENYLYALFAMFRPTFASEGNDLVRVLYSQSFFLYTRDIIKDRHIASRAIRNLEKKQMLQKVPDEVYKNKAQETCFLIKGHYWEMSHCYIVKKHLSLLTRKGIEAIKQYLCDRAVGGCEVPVEKYLENCLVPVDKLVEQPDLLVKDFATTILSTAHYLNLINELSTDSSGLDFWISMQPGIDMLNIVFPDFFITYKKESIMIYLFTGEDEKDIERISRSAEIARTYGKTAIWPATKMKKETLLKYAHHFDYNFETEVSDNNLNIVVTPTDLLGDIK